MPSAYLTFKTKDGQTIGKYLMSLHLNPQPVTVGDKTYKAALRFKQTYRPYRVELIEFRYDRWEGTQMARNFSRQRAEQNAYDCPSCTCRCGVSGFGVEGSRAVDQDV